MATGIYVKIDGVWKLVTSGYCKVDGEIKRIKSAWIKIDGEYKKIPLEKRRIYVPEQASERCYCISDTVCDVGVSCQGAAEWYYTTGGLVDPVAVCVDKNGNSYWACANKVYKLDASGNLASGWPYTGHTSTVLSVCIDADGNVYSGDFGGVVKKLNSSGVAQWSRTLGANYSVYGLCVDHSEGRLYVATGWGADIVYRFITSNGNYTSVYYSPADVVSIAIDETPKLYIGDNAGHIKQIDPYTGGVGWDTLVIGASILQVIVGHDGYGYAATGGLGKIRKFILSTGAALWSYQGGGSAKGVGVDKGGYVYGSFQTPGSSVHNVVSKIDKNGDWIWSWKPYLIAQMYGLAVTPGYKAAGFS